MRHVGDMLVDLLLKIPHELFSEITLWLCLFAWVMVLGVGVAKICLHLWGCRACGHLFWVWRWRKVRMCPKCKFAQHVRHG